MELRLLYGVAKGEPWFGRWGYRFGSGTYGVTQKIYEKALESLRNVPLCLLNHHLTGLNRETLILLSKYQNLSTEPLITLSDLFMFMLHLHSSLPRDNHMNNSRNQIISIDSTNCRWSQKRIQMAIKVVIESLKRVEYKWISRQEVRDAARNYIGDTGLLDFVLKSLGNQVVGNYLVRRSLNPVKKVLEYCLEDISNLLSSNNNELITLRNQNSMGKMMMTTTNGHNKITRGQVMKDMFYFYKHILMDSKGVFNQIGIASRTILDAKYFSKEYNNFTRETSFHLDQGDKLGIFCTITQNCHHYKNKTTVPPQECIVVKKDATMSEVYEEAERVFREIYWELRDVVVESMFDGQREMITRVNEMAMNGNKGLVLEGSVGMLTNIEVMKCYDDDDGGGGGDSKKKDKRIECDKCGAKEEDGERMVCCDICEVWQHTRCVGVQHNEEVPHIFICQSCDQHLIPLSFSP